MPSSEFSEAGICYAIFSFLKARVDSQKFFKDLGPTKTHGPPIYTFCPRRCSIVNTGKMAIK